ncbi:MAG: hypothetical protein OXG47_04385 [bacterium]|nr:hypothetical protein [bacterium]
MEPTLETFGLSQPAELLQMPWLAALAAAVVISGLLLARHRSGKRLVRGSSAWSARRRRPNNNQRKIQPEDYVKAGVIGIGHDLAHAVTKDRSEIAAGEAKIAALQEQEARHLQEIDRLTEQRASDDTRFDAEIEAVRENFAAEDNAPAAMTKKWSTLWGGFFLLGDVFVVSQAIMVQEGTVTPVIAYGTAIAISLMMWFAGKWLGCELRRFRMAQKAARVIVPVVLVLLVVSGALYVMRTGDTRAWIALALAPPLGTAATKVLGPTASQAKVATLSRAKESERASTQGKIDAQRSKIEQSLNARGEAAVNCAQRREHILSRTDAEKLRAKAVFHQGGFNPHNPDYWITLNQAGFSVEAPVDTCPHDPDYWDIPASAGLHARPRAVAAQGPGGPPNGIHPADAPPTVAATNGAQPAGTPA